MANQSDVLQPYKPQPYPTLEGSQARFLAGELQRVANTLAQIIEVVKQLDARLVAHGWWASSTSARIAR